jgi:hypothetical protein
MLATASGVFNGTFHVCSRLTGRFALLISRIVLSIVLLFNLDFETIYPRATPDYPIIGGVAPFNVTMATTLPGSLGDIIVPEYFVLLLQGLLRDPKASFPIPSQYDFCQTSTDCFSYVIPGDFSQIATYTNDPNNQTFLLNVPHGDAPVYVAEQVSVYQLDFFPVQNATSFLDSDCRVFGNFVFGTTMKLCFRNEGTDLIAGIR